MASCDKHTRIRSDFANNFGSKHQLTNVTHSFTSMYSSLLDFQPSHNIKMEPRILVTVDLKRNSGKDKPRWNCLWPSLPCKQIRYVFIFSCAYRVKPNTKSKQWSSLNCVAFRITIFTWVLLNCWKCERNGKIIFYSSQKWAFSNQPTEKILMH